MGLPSEIHLCILDFLLPRDLNNARTISLPVREQYPTSIDSDQLLLHAPKITPSHLSIRRYLSGISCVNRQFRRESLQLLYNYAIILEISEHTFWPDGADPCSILRYSKSSREWSWTAVLPGLDLARVRELRIVVEPTDYPGFWWNVRNAMVTFPWPRATMRCLRIDIGEVLDSMAHKPPDEHCIVAWEPAESTVEDVGDMLQVVGDLVVGVERLELNLPGFVKGVGWFEEGVRALEGFLCDGRSQRQRRGRLRGKKARLRGHGGWRSRGV